MPANLPLQHVLVTRFNLRMGRHVVDRRGIPVLTREWLEDRLALFERFCLPSVAHQTEQRFTWLLLLDEATDSETIRRLESTRAKVTQLELVYLPKVHGRAQLTHPIRARVSPETELLITTRLDNDDALHEGAIAEIRRQARPCLEFLNLRLGFVTDGDRVEAVSLRRGPFLSLVEPRGSGRFRTVHCSPHNKVDRVAPVRQIGTRRLWLRVVHDRNLINIAFEDARAGGTACLRGLTVRLRRSAATALHRAGEPDLHATRLSDIAGRFHIGEH